MAAETNWQFWIDVGGTFTDCLAVSPDGGEQFTKVLSSGIVKGRAKISAGRWIDPRRQEKVDDFWGGAIWRWLDDAGQVMREATVRRFDSAAGAFELDQDFVPPPITSSVSYELDARLPAPVLAIHLLQGVPISQQLVDCHIDLGTTRGTNALLTRTGARTALITSSGLQDLLRIGDQTRPKLFELTVVKPEPLFETAIEIDERVLSDGTVEFAPQPPEIVNQLRQLKEAGIESLAICLMFGYQFPEHEKIVSKLATAVGFRSIRCSSDVAPVIKIVPRGETTVLDAYLDPVIASYLDEVQSNLSPASRLRFMTSSGGLVSRNRFSGKDSVLSGPAGGVVGAARVAQAAGFERVIGFDMGGTSTDVSRFDGDRNHGEFERTFETIKAGVRIVTPMLAVETVAAGGGSICWFDGTRLRVGPASAGADPGPACYGRGGKLAMTDINLFLGRLQREQFPFELDWVAVEKRLDQLIEEMSAFGHPMSRESLAAGFLKIANHNMSAAVQTVSVAKGFDPREYLLLSFGGAGSQHGCGVAENLGMTKILDHPNGSILSAVGIRLADQASHAVAAVGTLAAETADNDLSVVFARLAAATKEALIADGNEVDAILITRSLDFRYARTDGFLTIPFPVTGNVSAANIESCCQRFHQQHRQQFGYVQDRPLEIVSARVHAKVTGNRLSKISWPTEFTTRKSQRAHSIWSGTGRATAAFFHRKELKTGDLIVGPALIADQHTTTIVDQGWEAKVLTNGVLFLEHGGLSGSPTLPTVDLASQVSSRSLGGASPLEIHAPDPIQLEIFNNHFSSIARQMGISLQQTSVSVNVKERLDFSCAIFTRTGDLVVNAPHIPVHLGAMSETVRSVIRLNPNISAGEVVVTNDPFAGGSHLPDVTVVTPVFDPAGRELWFWVASRSHHAEIGGTAPGSMPAGAKCLAEEGVLIQNFRLIERSVSQPTDHTRATDANLIDRFDALRQRLTSGRYPSRSPAENLADLRAQVAANQTGLDQLRQLVARYSFPTVAGYMMFIQDAAEQKSRDALRCLPDGKSYFEDSLDNGATIRVSLEKRDDELTIDFNGTDPVLPDNLNANRAIVSSVAMYVLRLLIDEDIPLNEGVMKPVTILLPECFLNPKPLKHLGNEMDVESESDHRLEYDATRSPAVVGGNVETSQRIVDCLLGAIGIAAASQGTMNNWLMGNTTFGYYETVGGGGGATAAGPGADAIHTHMTNTRLTDPEIFETRYPVILRTFKIRRRSGGVGRQRGGDGMIREIEFREPMTLSLLTSRRVSQPYGMAGGMPGASGVNRLIRADGTLIELPSRCEVEVANGDRIRLETPGGGGFGAPSTVPNRR